MPDPATLIVAALAVARITGLVVTDTLTEPPRRWLLNRFDDRENTLGHWAGYLLTCPWCASVWVAALAAPLVYFHHSNPWVVIPAMLLAFSQVTGMISDVGR